MASGKAGRAVRGALRQAGRSPTAGEIVRAVRRGERNPYLQGSPEGIAFAFAEELKRHAARSHGAALSGASRRALDHHDQGESESMSADPGRGGLPSPRGMLHRDAETSRVDSPDDPAYWIARGWRFHPGPAYVPVVNESDERVGAILANRPAVFDIENDRGASDTAPWHIIHERGFEAVRDHDAIIRRVADDTGVDADLIRAVMYVENSQGHYFGLAEAAEWLGVAKTLFPMNINSDLWGALLPDEADFAEPEANIRLGAELLRRISDRLLDPTPEKIASIWNFAGNERTNDIGARVQWAYEHRPWEVRDDTPAP